MISRRRFVQSSMTAALVPLLPKAAFTATTATTAGGVTIRPSWEAFAQGPYLQAFIDAIATMRANRDETDLNSWYYWVKVHQDECPHGRPYFLAWHRGLLKRFEGELRRVSGISDMPLPYWNYYANPQVPPEFQVEHSSLWRGNRVSTDVTGALSLAPFDDSVTGFERGQSDALEPTIETAPHNPVHNIIGGAMSNIRFSPADPLFYVHHANIDRLWAAWCAAGNGREMPPEDDIYWQGDPLQYGPAIRSVPKIWTYATTSTYMKYDYDDLTMPTGLPGSYPASMARPASEPVPTLAPARTGAATQRLGGTGQFALDERSVTFDIPVLAQGANHIRSLMLRPAARAGAAAPLELVMEDVRLTGLGEQGGFFYKVFVNLPRAGAAARPERDYLVGMIGPFEIGVAQMQARMAAGMPMGGAMGTHAKGATTLRFPVMGALRRIWPVDLDTLSVSLVRVGRQGRPGRVIVVGRMRLEARTTP